MEPVEEIGAKPALPAELGQIPMGGRDHPDIGGAGGSTTHPFELPFLQDPQELCLELQGQIPDLIEEDRPPIREVEAAELARQGPGKSPFFVPEQLTFGEAGRDSGAIELDPSLVFPSAQGMDQPGNRFLAGAGFAGHEHGGIGASDTLHHLYGLARGGGGPYEILAVVARS